MTTSWIDSDRPAAGDRGSARRRGRAGAAASARAEPVTQRGMVGGGLAQFDAGEANFSLFASRMIFAEDDRRWSSAASSGSMTQAGLTLKSTAITDYIVPEVQPEQGSPAADSRDDERQRRGRVSVRARGHRRGSARDWGRTRSMLTVGDGARHERKRDAGQRPRVQLHGQRNGRHRRYPGDRHSTIDPDNGSRPAGGRLTAARLTGI